MVLYMNYLIMCESNRIIKNEINKIVGANLYSVYNYSDTSIESILEDASFVDLFSTEKYIIIYESKLNKSDLEKLNKYLENPSINHLIFVSNEKVSAPKNIEVIDKLGLNFKNYKPMLISYIKSLGYMANDEVLFYIMDTCLYNYDLMLNEVDKICLYYDKPGSFNITDVKKIVSKNIVNNINKLFTNILKKDYVKIDKIYRDLKLLKVDNYVITAFLGKAFGNLLIIKEYVNMGKSGKEMASATGLKTYQIDEYNKYSSVYSIDEIKKFIVELANIDFYLKTGITDPEHALDVLFLDL